MKVTTLHRYLVLFLLAVVLALPTVSPARTHGSATSDDGFLLSINDSRIVTLRLEIFDHASQRIFDSGPVVGPDVRVEPSALAVSEEDPELSYELRGWDAEGRLVLSQISALSKGTSLISAIQFDTIPSGTKILSPTIGLNGSVDVQQHLTVNQSVRTNELRNSNGGSFFGTCPAGSSIRSIGATGSVSCETDDVGSASGDDLGDHVATRNLDMGSHEINFDDASVILRSDGNAQLRTGNFGHTFMIRGGDTPVHDIMQFRDAFDAVKLRVNGAGRLMFLGGQKVCSVFTGTWRSSLLVSDGWTAATCANYQNLIASGGNYQLYCLFDNGYSFGNPGGGVPSNNCGW